MTPQQIEEFRTAIGSIPDEEGIKLMTRIRNQLNAGRESNLIPTMAVILVRKLVEDPWWEPTRVKTGDFATMIDAGVLELWQESIAVVEEYIDKALQLRGDTPAIALRYRDLVADAMWYWEMDLRNMMREFLIEHGVIEANDPMADA